MRIRNFLKRFNPFTTSPTNKPTEITTTSNSSQEISSTNNLPIKSEKKLLNLMNAFLNPPSYEISRKNLQNEYINNYDQVSDFKKKFFKETLVKTIDESNKAESSKLQLFMIMLAGCCLMSFIFYKEIIFHYHEAYSERELKFYVYFKYLIYSFWKFEINDHDSSINSADEKFYQNILNLIFEYSLNSHNEEVAEYHLSDQNLEQFLNNKINNRFKIADKALFNDHLIFPYLLKILHYYEHNQHLLLTQNNKGNVISCITIREIDIFGILLFKQVFK